MTPEEFQTLFAQFRELKQTAEAELVKLAKETEQWLPIDMAPRDGTRVILCGFSRDSNTNMWRELGGWCDKANDWIRFPGSVVSERNYAYLPPKYFLPLAPLPDPKKLPY